MLTFGRLKIHHIRHPCQKLQNRQHNGPFLGSYILIHHAISECQFSFISYFPSLFLNSSFAINSFIKCAILHFGFHPFQNHLESGLQSPPMCPFSGHFQIHFVQGNFRFQEYSYCILRPLARLCFFFSVSPEDSTIVESKFLTLAGEAAFFSIFGAVGYIALFEYGSQQIRIILTPARRRHPLLSPINVINIC